MLGDLYLLFFCSYHACSDTSKQVGGRVNNHLRKQGGNKEVTSVKTVFTSSKERQDLGSKCQKKF